MMYSVELPRTCWTYYTGSAFCFQLHNFIATLNLNKNVKLILFSPEEHFKVGAAHNLVLPSENFSE